MKLSFESNFDFQLDAINSIVNLFERQTKERITTQSKLTYVNKELKSQKLNFFLTFVDYGHKKD